MAQSRRALLWSTLVSVFFSTGWLGGCQAEPHRLVLQVAENPLFNPFADNLDDDLDLVRLDVYIEKTEASDEFDEYNFLPGVGDLAGGGTIDLGALGSSPNREVYAEGYNAFDDLVAYGASTIQQLLPGWTTTVPFRRTIAYVAYQAVTPGENGVMFVDLVSGDVLGKVDYGAPPRALAMSIRGEYVYVALDLGGTGTRIRRFDTRSHLSDPDWILNLGVGACADAASMGSGGYNLWVYCAGSNTLVRFSPNGVDFDRYDGPAGAPATRDGVEMSAGRSDNPWLLLGSMNTLFWLRWDGIAPAFGTYTGGGVASDSFGPWVYASEMEGVARVDEGNENNVDIQPLPMPTAGPVLGIATTNAGPFKVFVLQDNGGLPRLYAFTDPELNDTPAVIAQAFSIMATKVAVGPNGGHALVYLSTGSPNSTMVRVDVAGRLSFPVIIDPAPLMWTGLPAELIIADVVIPYGSGE